MGRLHRMSRMIPRTVPRCSFLRWCLQPLPRPSWHRLWFPWWNTLAVSRCNLHGSKPSWYSVLSVWFRLRWTSFLWKSEWKMTLRQKTFWLVWNVQLLINTGGWRLLSIWWQTLSWLSTFRYPCTIWRTLLAISLWWARLLPVPTFRVWSFQQLPRFCSINLRNSRWSFLVQDVCLLHKLHLSSCRLRRPCFSLPHCFEALVWALLWE